MILAGKTEQKFSEVTNEKVIGRGCTPIKEDKCLDPPIKPSNDLNNLQADDVTDSREKLTELGNEDGKGDASDLEKPADTLSNSYAGNGGNSVCGLPQPSLTPTEPSQNQDDIPIRRELLTSEPLSKLGYGTCANAKDGDSLQMSNEDVSISFSERIYFQHAGCFPAE